MREFHDALRALPDAVFADLLEREDAYLLVVDLPGVRAADLDLFVEAGRLTIEARRAKDVPPEFDYRSEDRSVFLDATVPLPPDATGTDADAAIEHGVLEVRLPKRSATATPIPVAGE